MVDNSHLIVDRIFFGFGFFIAVLVVMRPSAVFRFLGDGDFVKIDPRWIRAVQLISVVVAAGAATHIIRSFLR